MGVFIYAVTVSGAGWIAVPLDGAEASAIEHLDHEACVAPAAAVIDHENAGDLLGTAHSKAGVVVKEAQRRRRALELARAHEVVSCGHQFGLVDDVAQEARAPGVM